MPYKIIGKSILGNIGFLADSNVMKKDFQKQLRKIKECLQRKDFIMIPTTSREEIQLTNGEYFPKIVEFKNDISSMFRPNNIYEHFIAKKHFPCCDFVIFDSSSNIVATTFSREAPILAFESSNGKKALGVIKKTSLNKYGDYLFASIKKALDNTNITVTVVTCNHYKYSGENTLALFHKLADKYEMKYVIGLNSETYFECYHKGEKGNHVVALW